MDKWITTAGTNFIFGDMFYWMETKQNFRYWGFIGFYGFSHLHYDIFEVNFFFFIIFERVFFLVFSMSRVLKYLKHKSLTRNQKYIRQIWLDDTATT